MSTLKIIQEHEIEDPDLIDLDIDIEGKNINRK